MATRTLTTADMTSRRDGKFAACRLHTCSPGGGSSGGWGEEESTLIHPSLRAGTGKCGRTAEA